MILPTILFLLTVTCHTLGLPLKPSDLGHHGYIVHYHRDESGSYTRHIHYLPADKPSQQSFSSRESHLQNDATPVNTAPYELPSNSQSSGGKTSGMVLRLRSLVKDSTSDINTTNSNNGNDKSNVYNSKNSKEGDSFAHRVQNRDAPSNDKISKATALPPGLQFLNKPSEKKRNSTSISDADELNVNFLLRGMFQSTTLPSVSKSDVLDLGFLLGDLYSSGNLGDQSHSHDHSGLSDGHAHLHQDHAHTHSHNHEQTQNVHSHEHNHDVHDHGTGLHNDKTTPKTFKGLFNQQVSEHAHKTQSSNGHSHIHHDVATAKTPTTIYQKATLHTKPITKRDLSDGDSVSRFPKTFVDNILNIRIRNTSPVPLRKATWPSVLTNYLTTPRSIETQIEPLSGINLHSVRKMNRDQQRRQPSGGATQSKEAPPVVPPTQKELFHLQGIHIMFSNGQQDTSKNIPTIHLTAAVSENIDNMIRKVHQDANISDTNQRNDSHNALSDRITGTAVIRDGHLYLVVYPFGQNKSLELHFNETVNRVPIPEVKPVSRINIPNPTIQDPIKTSTQTMFQSTTAKTIKTPSPLVHAHTHKQKHGSNVADTKHSHQHHGDHHHHHPHQHGVAAPSLTDLQLAEVNDTTLQTLLAPINRLMSPWKSLNFSRIVPFNKGNGSRSSKKQQEEDNDIDVVTFIAKATDPFERIKTIIESLANTTLLNTTSNSTAEAKFNFELSIQQGSGSNAKESESSSGHTGDFKTTTSSVESVTESSKTVATFSNQDRFETIQSDNFTPSQSSYDQQRSEPTDPSINQINTSNDVGGPTTYLPEVNSRLTGFDRPDMHKTSTTAAPELTTYFNTPRSTLKYLPKYTFSPLVNNNRILGELAASRQSHVTAQRPSSFISSRNTPLSSNIQSFSPRIPVDNVRYSDNVRYLDNPGHAFNDGHTEQLISLADVLNDIRRIQLHNMHRFNIRNNNFNALLLSEAHQNPVVRNPIVIEGPLFPETSTRSRGQSANVFSNSNNNQQLGQGLIHNNNNFNQQINSFNSNTNNNNQQRRDNRYIQQEQSIVTPFPVTANRRVNERSALQDALDAMLVLSVDDIMADQSTLHGAIVLSNRRDSSSNSNNK